MAEFTVSPYMRDWNLLSQIAIEWAQIRKTFQLGSRATAEQIDAHFDAIFRTTPPQWPSIPRLAHELLSDDFLRRYIACVYLRGFPKYVLRVHPTDVVINAVLLRLIWQVARNASSWLQDRSAETRQKRQAKAAQNKAYATLQDDQDLEHWGRFFGWRAMMTEIERAIGGMTDVPPSGGSGLDDSPEPTDEDSLLPEDRAGILDEAGGRLTRQEMAVFRDCMSVAWGDTEQANAEIAARHGISEAEVSKILIRGLQPRDNN